MTSAPLTYGLPTRQLARVWVDAAAVSPSVDQLSRLQKAAARSDLMTKGALDLVSVSPPDTLGRSSPAFKQRTVLSSPIGEWQLGLLTGSFDLALSPLDDRGSNLRPFDEFVQHAISVLCTALDVFDLRANRIALVNEGFLPPMSTEQLKTAAISLFRLPPFFQETQPFEWDWRCASHVNVRVGKADEVTNAIVTAKRLSCEINLPDQALAFDRIRVDVDVNTAPEFTELRFGTAEVSDFLLAALELHTQLGSQLEQHLRGSST
jgi:hypothetical protein